METKDKKRDYKVPSELMDALHDPWSKKELSKQRILPKKKISESKKRNSTTSDTLVKETIEKFNTYVFESRDELKYESFCSEEVISKIETELVGVTYISSMLVSVKEVDQNEIHKLVDFTLFQTVDKGKSLLRKNKQVAQSMHMRVRLMMDVDRKIWRIDKLKIKGIESMDY
ncbi:hypothetical protein M2475_001688 [Breznakia sp. PF5-3]|uniref:hypothetical protein n=1 Tax=unclassified Breznakia TaxID=2623764 RepID=UPI002405B0CD|nr:MULTISPECIES: hypothetical protein [unclassified Breznakia]MDF9825246.1 hypothetical protein [Breznakia sp. PM6-1]MDF9836112.1 hypothetical protein [Breznakia sp. PF5-3]MDF9838399.1 hypothetical protein [Breznakia sp. PFB2-8]MDF9860415.1 hypothetical protein [Breznakia sp. PH5-24]